MILTNGSFEFPELIDSTMRASFVSCPAKFYWEWMRRLVRAQTSPDLHAGGCFAKGVEVVRRAYYEHKLSQEEALVKGFEAMAKMWGDYEPPEGHVKTFARMVGALVAYFEHRPMALDHIQPHWIGGKLGVEFTFAIPIPGTRHPVTGNPILYGGRSDMIAVYNDAKFIVDEKTTKQLGPTWGNQWEMRAQFTGYTWAAQTYGIDVAGTVIRGISILKYDYGHAEHIVFRSPKQVDGFVAQLSRDVNRMIQAWEEGAWDQSLDAACAAYGNCPNMMLCQADDPEPWVSQYYVRNNWNPLAVNPEET